MLVMALEEYDEVTGKAAKAPIMLPRRGRAEPAGHASPPPRKGCWSRSTAPAASTCPYIASLYGKPEEDHHRRAGRPDLPRSRHQTPGRPPTPTCRATCGPSSRRRGRRTGLCPQRRRLAVQPEDVLPGDIDANLGAPWLPAIPTSRRSPPNCSAVPPVAVTDRPPEERRGVERRGRPSRAEASVAATAEYGTPAANGTWLLRPRPQHEDPGDLRHRIRTTRRGAGRQQEATLAAQGEAEAHQGAVQGLGVRADPERTERLVRLYNDTYNNLRPRLFDGSHLDFPGMSQGGRRCGPHQKDAVWRGMSGGNTLLAHAVGAGKTFTMAATGMKLRQAGLVRRSRCLVVPNHMLEQFSPRIHAALPQRQACSSPARRTWPRTAASCSPPRSPPANGTGSSSPTPASSGSACRRTTRSRLPARADRRVRPVCSAIACRDRSTGPQHHQDHRETEGPPARSG